eukprot:GEMP01084403.1.p1 GENE.GEMP01084403.1~~GEMP01084403.1.p1  ORF type:complete len:300 (+),score=45.72 GEMP01084403.1:109-900(+)
MTGMKRGAPPPSQQAKITDFFKKKPKLASTETTAKEETKIENKGPDERWIREFGQMWAAQLGDIFAKTYFSKILQEVEDDVSKGSDIFPARDRIFEAFRLTSFDKIRVVIIGDKPYCQRSQASGLAYSVPKGALIPPSLSNIYKELKISCDHGDLTSWAEQGVFLLNSCLVGSATRGKVYNWGSFTDYCIHLISKNKENVIFLLWGREALDKKGIIDDKKHKVLSAGSPSPLHVKDFRGCGHFRKVNEILAERGENEIDWAPK